MIDASTTLNRIVDQLVKITERLDKVSTSTQNTSQYARYAEAYKEEYATRAHQPKSKEKAETNSFIKQLRDSIFGKDSPANLSSNEKSRYTQIGKILKPIFAFDSIEKAIDSLKHSIAESNSNSLIKQLFGKFFGKDSPANLSSNEKSRYTQIGKILKPIFAFDSIEKAINSLRDAIAESNEQRAREGLFQSFKNKIFGKSDKEKSEDKAKSQNKEKGFFASIWDVGKKIAGGAALIALGIGLSMLIKSLKDTGSIDTASIMTFIKVLGVVTVGIIALAAGAYVVTKILSNFAGGLLKGAIAFGILAYTLNNQIIPSLEKLKDVKWDDIKGGIVSVGAVLGLLVFAVSEVTGGGLKSLLGGKGTSGFDSLLKTGAGVGGIAALTWVLHKKIIPAVMALAPIKWDDIKEGIKAVGAVLGGLVLTLNQVIGGGIKSLITGGTSSWGTMLKQGVGIGMIGALVWILKDQIAPGLMALSQIKWEDVEGGLKAAGVALGGMTVLVGIISKLLGDNPATMAKNILSAVASGGLIYGIIFLLKELGTSMQSFTQFKWDDIETNIQGAGKALLAMTGLTSVIGGIIALTGGTAALVGAGAEALLAGLSWNLGYLAENIAKYNAVDADKIKAVADNLGPLGISIGKFVTIGGVASLAQVGSGILDKVMGLFGKDIISSIRAYENINASKLEESSKALNKLGSSLQIIYNVFNIIKDIAPKNILDIKVRGSVDAEFIKTVEQLSSKLGDLNKFTGPQIAGSGASIAGDQHVKLAGISELQQAVEDISRQEIAIMGEQLVALRNATSLLTQIRDNQMLPPEDVQQDIFSPPSQYSTSGEPVSETRGAFGNRNLMSMSLKR